MSIHDYLDIDEVTHKEIKEGKLSVSNGKIVPREDLTIQGAIDKHGGIYSQADRKMYHSKGDYLESLKRQNLVIKDWKD